MTYYHELEPYIEEFMEYGAGIGLLANSFSSLLSIAVYVLTSLALYTLAGRRGIKHAWLSWVPIANFWIIGSLSDQYRYVVKGEIKNKRKILLVLHIISWLISVTMIVVFGVLIFRAMGPAMSGLHEDVILEMIIGPVFVMLGLAVPMIGVGIASKIIRYMAMYDIYTSCTPQNNVVFLVLSILFPVTEPFFLFFTRNKDDGMPPRKQEPVYEAPQESWDNTEYL